MLFEKWAAAAAALGLLVAACGSGDPTGIEAGSDSLSANVTTTVTTAQQSTSTSPSAHTSTTAAPNAVAAPNLYPDLSATDVATGESVSLRSLGGTGTPAVLWYWYPH